MPPRFFLFSLEGVIFSKKGGSQHNILFETHFGCLGHSVPILRHHCLKQKLFSIITGFRGREIDAFMSQIRNVVRKKNGIMWQKFPSGGPPPVWETPVIKKKVGFIFHFRTSGTFLVFTKKSQFWPQRKQLR